jgi:dUTP pyrophosphatase
MVKLHNDGNRVFSISQGDRIAQAMVVPVQQVTFDTAEELSNTARGVGGFGSTGV